jgi:lipopolysaccharide transport system permease protein
MVIIPPQKMTSSSKFPPINLPSVNKKASKSTWFNPVSIFRTLFHNRELIWNMTKREIKSTYQGSFLGVLWTLILPIMMLLIYTFVFSVVFQAKWSGTGVAQQTPRGEYALILFAGLTPFNFFSAVINRAPGMVLAVPNYVKKVIFPLEILPIVVSGAALFTSFINIGLILIGSLLIYHTIPLSLWMLPFAYIPLILLTLGLAWFLASLGVFIRDVSQAISIIVQILFFMSPIFYSADAVPKSLKLIVTINPLSSVIDSFRRVLIWNQWIDWPVWGIVTLISALIAILGYAWFSATKKGFADVI